MLPGNLRPGRSIANTIGTIRCIFAGLAFRAGLSVAGLPGVPDSWGNILAFRWGV